MDISSYWVVLRRWSLMLVAAAIVSGAVGYAVSSQSPSTYEARARLLVGPVNGEFDVLRASSALTVTYAALAVTEPQMSEVATELGGSVTAEDLSETLTVQSNADTRILTVVARHADAGSAAGIANAAASQLVALARTPGAAPAGRVTLIDPAVAPSEPVAPNVTMVALMAAAAGLIFAGAIAALFEYFGSAIRTPSDLAKLAGVPALGSVPAMRRRTGSGLGILAHWESDSAAALRYRSILLRMPLGTADGVRSLLVLACDGSRDADDFAGNLAATAARAGRRVILAEVDDPEVRLQRVDTKPARRGKGDEPPAVDVNALGVAVSSGLTFVPLPETHVASQNDAGELLEVFADNADVSIIASAPVHQSRSALLLAPAVDGVVIVAQASHVHPENVAYTAESLRYVSARVIGAVLLEREGWRPFRRRRSSRVRRDRETPAPALK